MGRQAKAGRCESGIRQQGKQNGQRGGAGISHPQGSPEVTIAMHVDPWQADDPQVNIPEQASN
jgi:hypothetical protein